MRIVEVMKRHLALVGLTLALSSGLAASQDANYNRTANAATHSSNPALKPLTPKSAMPGGRKSSATLPATNSSRQSSSELSRMERQNGRTASSAKASNTTPKAAPIKSIDKPSGGSGINASYQKPKARQK